METTKSDSIGIELLSREAFASERSFRMEAYMFREDYHTMVWAEKIDRDPMQFDPLGNWQLGTGGG